MDRSHIPMRHQIAFHHGQSLTHSHHQHHHHPIHGNYTLSETEDKFYPDEEHSSDTSNNEILQLTLDEAIEMNHQLGYFHYRILLLCGLAFMGDALEVNLLAFLSTCAGIEWSLTDTQKASITGIVFCGIIIGSAIWGVVSDVYGRKVGFILATLTVSIGGFLTSIATSYLVLLFCRAIVGIGIGGTSVPFDLLAELMPVQKRGVFLIYIQYFWAIGSMMVSGLAWLLLDHYGWRILALITVIPVALTAIISMVYLPESPRWLLSMGKCYLAEKIVQEAAMMNGLKLPPFQLRLDHTTTTPSLDNPDVSSPTRENTLTVTSEGSLRFYWEMLRNPHIRKVMFPLWLVWGSFGFTYYGIILFVSRLNTTSSKHSSSCSFHYASIFYNAFSEILSVTLSALLLEPIGRIRMQTLFYLFGAMAVFLMGFELSTIALLIISMMGRIAVFTSSNATWVSTPELFATEYRTFGHSICLAISKLGAFISPYVVQSQLHPFYVGLTLCLLNVVAALAAGRLPETSGMQLDSLGGTAVASTSPRNHPVEKTDHLTGTGLEMSMNPIILHDSNQKP